MAVHTSFILRTWCSLHTFTQSSFAAAKFFNVIMYLLKENPRGLNIKEIVIMTGYNRVGLPHYMKVLVELGYADLRQIGRSKIYYMADSPRP